MAEPERDPLPIRALDFLGGMASPGGWRPESELPEVAVVGRSNVGKSSLLNRLFQRKQFARVSNSPGRTREINFFAVNDAFLLVDLPGYGFARVAKSRRAEWQPLIESYLRDNPRLRGILMLLDARRDPSEEDDRMLEVIAELEVPMVLVVTKIDKFRPTQAAAHIQRLSRAVDLNPDQVIPFSAVTNAGRDEIAAAIADFVDAESTMVLLPLKPVAECPAHDLCDEWLEELADALRDPAADRSAICRKALTPLFYPEFAANWETAIADPKLPRATRLALATMDPRNVTLEPEYYGDCDAGRFQRVKPLLWLWYSFDRSPAGGQNVWLGIALRRLLAPHIFKRCGENFKAFHNVEFSFGYNLEVGDNVVVHRHVLLDDRGGLVLGNNVSISDYANVYSHTHSIVEQRDVTNAMTVIEDGVRITYHATILAGVRVAEQGMVGAMAVATKDVRPYHVYVGIPAKSVRVKPNAPASANVLRTAAERRREE